MRITFVTHFPGRGGSTNLLKQLQGFFESLGHRTSIVCGADDPHPQHENYLVVPPVARRRRRHEYLEAIARTNPDVVYVISGAEEFDVIRFLKVPRIHHIFSLENHDRIDISRLLRKTGRFTELFTANTPDTLHRIQRLTGVSNESLALAPYRLSSLWFNESSPNVRPPGAPVRICFSGRLEPFQKRAHWLPKIIRESRRQGFIFRWDILGDGPCLSSLREDLAPLSDSVTFHGWADGPTMKKIYGASDVFFLCSRWEGLPVAMAEAMTCGVACVVPSGPGGMEFAVNHRDAGWLYEASSPTACVRALAQVAQDPSVLERKKRNARQSAIDLFSPATVNEALLGLDQTIRRLVHNGTTLDPQRTLRLRSVSALRALKRRTLEAIPRAKP